MHDQDYYAKQKQDLLEGLELIRQWVANSEGLTYTVSVVNWPKGNFIEGLPSPDFGKSLTLNITKE